MFKLFDVEGFHLRKFFYHPLYFIANSLWYFGHGDTFRTKTENDMVNQDNFLIE
jgi:hypothetical protein